MARPQEPIKIRDEKPKEHDFEIERGVKPATTIRELVNAQRQNFAGAGADLYTIRLLLDGDFERQQTLALELTLRIMATGAPEQGSLREELLKLAERVEHLDEAVYRLQAHVEKANDKASLAFANAGKK